MVLLVVVLILVGVVGSKLLVIRIVGGNLAAVNGMEVLTGIGFGFRRNLPVVIMAKNRNGQTVGIAISRIIVRISLTLSSVDRLVTRVIVTITIRIARIGTLGF